MWQALYSPPCSLVAPNPNLPAVSDEGDDLFGDVFDDIGPPDLFGIKKEQVGTGLAALISYKKLSRADVVSNLGWKKSRISSVLAGKGNLTIKTIYEVSSFLGYEFDVIFRIPGSPRPLQPWQFSSMPQTISGVGSVTPSIIWAIQSSEGVKNDFTH